MGRLRIKEILEREGEGENLTLHGWIRTRRDMGAISFMAISDGSCLSTLQVVVDNSKINIDNRTLKKMQNGASVTVTGTLNPSPAKGQNVELHATDITILGEVPEEGYPLQKKRHSFEFLRDIAHLRPRTNTIGAVARIRSGLSFAIHKFFNERGFLYVHTPIITGSDAEGAGEMFQVTTLKEINSKTDYKKDFFAKKAHLTVSGQLQGEVYATALSDIYTFGPTFRAENSNTTRHIAEFWMIEPEMAFCDLQGNATIATEFIQYLIKYCLEHHAEDMAFFNQWIQKGVIDDLTKVANASFEQMSYTDAIGYLEKNSEKFKFKPEWGIDLQTEHEKFLTEEVVKGPLVVVDYPKEIKAFYMKQNDDGKTVGAMDVLVPRLGEIIGGSEREADYQKLLNAIEKNGGTEEEYWWYLDLRRYGTVPHSGFGLGFERLIMYITGMQNIRDVIPFPRTVRNVEF